jgi:hypothetical protein
MKSCVRFDETAFPELILRRPSTLSPASQLALLSSNIWAPGNSGNSGILGAFPLSWPMCLGRMSAYLSRLLANSPESDTPAIYAILRIFALQLYPAFGCGGPDNSGLDQTGSLESCLDKWARKPRQSERGSAALSYCEPRHHICHEAADNTLPQKISRRPQNPRSKCMQSLSGSRYPCHTSVRRTTSQYLEWILVSAGLSRKAKCLRNEVELPYRLFL